jgi:hypothetical protein
MVDYVATSDAAGNLTAMCPECSTIMHRRASRAKLGQFAGFFDITFPLAHRQLSESHQPSVNRDFG